MHLLSKTVMNGSFYFGLSSRTPEAGLWTVVIEPVLAVISPVSISHAPCVGLEFTDPKFLTLLLNNPGLEKQNEQVCVTFFIDQRNVSLRCASWALILTSHIVHTNTWAALILISPVENNLLTSYWATTLYLIWSDRSVLKDKERVQFERHWFSLLQSWPDTQVLFLTQKMPIRFSSSRCVQYSLTISLHFISVYYFDENVTIIILLIKLNWVKLVKVALCSFYRKKKT